MALYTKAGKFRPVGYDEVASVPTPAGTSTWEPVKHAWVLDAVRSEIARYGFETVKSDLRLSNPTDKRAYGAEFFGTIDVRHSESDAWGLSIGLRNTHNKRASAAILLGSRVWLCDNLSFSADFKLLRKHHADTYRALGVGIREIMSRLGDYVSDRRDAVNRMRATIIDERTAAHATILAARAGAILPADIVPVVDELRSPHSDNPAAGEWNAYGLLNAMTWISKPYWAGNPEHASERSLILEQTVRKVCNDRQYVPEFPRA